MSLGRVESVVARGVCKRRGGEFTPFTPVLNLTGQPAASVPWDEHDGLPVGVQLIARAGDEATLIRLASQLEEARPWIDRRPSVYLE